MKLIAVQSAYEFARLFVTSLVATQTGALVALIALGAQKAPPNAFTQNYSLAVFLIGLSLALGLLTAMLAYFNQYLLAFREEQTWLLWTAWVTGAASLLTLVLGGLLAYWAIIERTGFPK
ncbi:MAG: hypothetical protein B7Z44_05030 [Caulobacter sp. 12-67-6]|nr:MAG: hypothetical protein B7Z44_05030 [Caulobacter sp. 12-67-6]OYX69829.1 MAG: hypothetical protein B7Y81_13080 [Caulobacter sp. 32-67-35]HQR90246.1 hypothetical protein [Caulobacter sp.]